MILRNVFFAIQLSTVLLLAGCSHTGQTELITDSIDTGQPLPIKLTDVEAVDTTHYIVAERVQDWLSVDDRSLPLRRVSPRYPESALQSKTEGSVFVKCLVDSSGIVRKAIVLKTENIIFNRAALRAAMQWRFLPTQVDNKPAAVWTAIPVRFKLVK
jgi:TonB family protein